MSDEISFLVFAPPGSIFTEQAAESMVGTETSLDGSPIRIVAAKLNGRDSIRVTVEGVPPSIVAAVRVGFLAGVEASLIGGERRQGWSE